MEDIRFRAWDKKRSCWYGQHDTENRLVHIGFSLYGECMLLDTPSIDDLCDIEFEQYTGLKDKNCVEIYEGDVCVSYVHPDIPIYHKIVWSDKYCGWFAKNFNNIDGKELSGDIQLFVYLKCGIEVIGNIHENKGLLDNADNKN